MTRFPLDTARLMPRGLLRSVAWQASRGGRRFHCSVTPDLPLQSCALLCIAEGWQHLRPITLHDFHDMVVGRVRDPPQKRSCMLDSLA